MNQPPYGPPPAKKGPSVALIILLVLGALLALGFGGCALCVCVGARGMSDAKQRRDEKSASERANAGSVELGVLLMGYRANEIAADNQYKGRVLHVRSGTVREIAKTFTDRGVLRLEAGPRELFDASCELKDDALKRAAKLKKGASVTVTGRVHGLILHSVMIDDCDFEATP